MNDNEAEKTADGRREDDPPCEHEDVVIPDGMLRLTGRVVCRKCGIYLREWGAY